jgi:hypothetical protein
MADVNTSDPEQRYEVSFDGLVAVLSRDLGSNPDIFIATRESIEAPFGPWEPVAAVNTPDMEFDPHLSPDALELWHTSAGHPDSLGGQDIYVSRRPDRGSPFEAPAHVAELSSAANDGNATLTADGLTVVFTSCRGESCDLWYATRSSREASFGAPVPVPDVNTTYGDVEPYVSRDGCELIFCRFGDPSGAGGWDLFATNFL